jgi:hypothetical protein
MVLLHGGSPNGAERIAACWADSRKVQQIAFKPDWSRHAKAAPFKRNDQMLDAMPIGVIVFPVPASRPIFPTRPSGSASRSGGSATAAPKRRHTSHPNFCLRPKRDPRRDRRRRQVMPLCGR